MPFAESLHKRYRAQPTQEVPMLFIREADGPGGLLILCSLPRCSRLTEPQLEAVREVSQQIIATGDVPPVCWVTTGGDITPIPKPDPAWVRRWASLYSGARIIDQLAEAALHVSAQGPLAHKAAVPPPAQRLMARHGSRSIEPSASTPNSPPDGQDVSAH